MYSFEIGAAALQGEIEYPFEIGVAASLSEIGYLFEIGAATPLGDIGKSLSRPLFWVKLGISFK